MEEEIELNEESASVNWGERLLCLLLGIFAGAVITTAMVAANRQLQPLPLLIEPPPLPSSPTPWPTTTATPTPAPLAVYVSGAVAAPGLYTLPAGARLADALAAAGGELAEAEMAQVNLAQPLRDGDQVHLPRAGERAQAPPLVQTAAPLAVATEVGGGPRLVNINEAGAALLETLPGIGPTTAANIIAYREANGPFATIAAIQQVPGIGAAKFRQIAPMITVGE